LKEGKSCGFVDGFFSHHGIHRFQLDKGEGVVSNGASIYFDWLEVTAPFPVNLDWKGVVNPDEETPNIIRQRHLVEGAVEVESIQV